MNRSGFTLLEMMVASLLLGMLATALTMLFNSSAIAWRTGVAGVSQLDEVRTHIGGFHDIQGDFLPNAAGGEFRIVSLWDPESGDIRSAARAVAKATDYSDMYSRYRNAFQPNQMKTGAKLDIAAGFGTGQGANLYNVGVRSVGPDGVADTADDITTWPDQID